MTADCQQTLWEFVPSSPETVSITSHARSEGEYTLPSQVSLACPSIGTPHVFVFSCVYALSSGTMCRKTDVIRSQILIHLCGNVQVHQLGNYDNSGTKYMVKNV